MRVYISVDMEGIAGISHHKPTSRTDSEYPAAVGLMVGEANAAIAGAVAAGATDVLVNDSHGGMFNLTPAALDPAARLLQGQKPWSMVAGAATPEGSGLFDVALFVGYHARAGHPTGTIAHTYTRTYRPQTNGKAERFNRTLLAEWAYARPWSSDGQRTRALTTWLHLYNHHRHHTAIGGPPAGRVSNLAGLYS